MKKLLAVVLAMAMLCGVAGVGAVAAEVDPRLARTIAVAEDGPYERLEEPGLTSAPARQIAQSDARDEAEKLVAVVSAAIKEFNQTHGGTGALEFVWDRYYWGSADGVFRRIDITVSGEVRDAAKGLELPERCNVTWNATLAGSTGGEPMLKNPYGVLLVGGIHTNGTAVESNCVDVVGLISGAQAIHIRTFDYNQLSGGITLYRGSTVSGDLRCDNYSTIHVWGGTFTGSVYSNGYVYIDDDSVVNLTHLTAHSIYLRDTPKVVLAGNGAVNVKIFNIMEPATIDFEDRLQNCILVKSKPIGSFITGQGEYVLDYEVWTVRGNVILDTYISIEQKGCLMIPEGAKLTVTGLQIWGGKVIVDGELVILDHKKIYADENASIAGKNAKTLRDIIHKNATFSSSLITTIHNATYQYIGMLLFDADQGPIMQFILRWIFYIRNMLG